MCLGAGAAVNIRMHGSPRRPGSGDLLQGTIPAAPPALTRINVRQGAAASIVRSADPE